MIKVTDQGNVAVQAMIRNSESDRVFQEAFERLELCELETLTHSS
jgi:hypothetical protein